jgi:hypothetical protein
MSIASNEARCTSCHAGYGWKDATFDFTDMTKMDCLVCHDRTGTYKKTPTAAGMPDPSVDLVAVAQSVGPTTRKTCGDCHFNGGGGEAVKHADLSRQLLTPDRNCDVHMGGYDFQCTECHRTRNHKIAGRSSSVPVVEGSISCTNCHTAKPHSGAKLLDHHLNKHSDTIACTTCHAPVYAKCKPTKVFWDWSKAGDKDRKPKKDKYGMPDYDWKKGEFLWKESAKPIYAWYGGFMKRILLGDKLDLDQKKHQHLRAGGIHQRSQFKDLSLQDHGRYPARGRRVRLSAGAPPFPQRQGRYHRILEAPRLAKGFQRRDEGGEPAIQRQIQVGQDQHVLGGRARSDAGGHGAFVRAVSREPER